MSNYYDFKLTITPEPTPVQVEKIKTLLQDNGWYGGWVDDLLDGDSANLSWYEEEHVAGMLKASKAYPRLLFALEVYPESEGVGVSYKKYFQAGKMQVVKRPDFPKFDPKKLK